MFSFIVFWLFPFRSWWMLRTIQIVPVRPSTRISQIFNHGCFDLIDYILFSDDHQEAMDSSSARFGGVVIGSLPHLLSRFLMNII